MISHNHTLHSLRQLQYIISSTFFFYGFQQLVQKNDRQVLIYLTKDAKSLHTHPDVLKWCTINYFITQHISIELNA